MQSRELESYWQYISSSIERLLACLDGLSEEQLNWRPLPTANSLYVLAIHTLANMEENLLATVCGQVVQRQRESEFTSQGSSSEAIHARWARLHEQVTVSLSQLSPSELDREREHPRRGKLMGREVLLITARHAAEHLGQAELTRDLLRAAAWGRDK